MSYFLMIISGMEYLRRNSPASANVFDEYFPAPILLVCSCSASFDEFELAAGVELSSQTLKKKM